jgi:putative tryptophan/tyrosine transport system substrate-binding protein
MKLKWTLLFITLFCLSNYCHARDYVISIVLSSDMELYKEVENGFNAFFAEKGIAVRISEHTLAGQEDKTVFSAVTAERPDLIFAAGEAGIKSAKQLTAGIPVVFSMIFNAGAYENQNASGVLLEIPAEIKIAGIKKVFPNVKTIGMLYSPNSAYAFAEISAECEKQGLTLKAKPVSSEEEFSSALDSVLPGSNCFLVIMDTKVYFGQTVKLLLLESIKKKVPVIGLSSFFTKAGAAISFDGDFKDMGLQAGEIAAKILSGEKASGIRPVHPRKYKYSLNIAAAKKLGITFPQTVIKDASEVFN